MLLMTGCGVTGEKTVSPEEMTITAVPEPTATPIDTPTPLPPVGVLLTPPGSDQRLSDELNPIIGSYIRDLGLRFQVLINLTEDDFQRDDYQIVVVLAPFPDLQTLAESTPDIKYLAVGFNDLTPGENLSVLRSGGGDYDIQGFIAGYIAALITPDWRVGALSVQENPDALAARDGFRTGVKYYCGLCNPKYAPTGINYLYPKYIDLPVDAADLQISANSLAYTGETLLLFYLLYRIMPYHPRLTGTLLRAMGASLVGIGLSLGLQYFLGDPQSTLAGVGIASLIIILASAQIIPWQLPEIKDLLKI